MLFDPARHEPLTTDPWDEAAARAAVRSIVRDIEEHGGSQGAWRVHPLDVEGDVPRTGFKSLYLGRAGVLWALAYLQREGAAETSLDLAAAIAAADAAYPSDPDTGEPVPSYFLGEVGILLVLWRLTGSAEAANRLHVAVASNIANPTHEALWAAPGTMIAAWHLWLATSEPRWRALFLDNVEQLWRTWTLDPRHGCHLWTQDLYGRIVQYLGAGHGFAGNAYPLILGASLLDHDRREQLFERVLGTLRVTARHEGSRVNWPPGMSAPRAGGASMLMQWCHGAPGIVTALAGIPARWSTELDDLLLAAGEAIWQAGPLEKGFGLCHGTAGNGYAFLKLHRRSGDALWLDRARRFAMHALAQHGRMRRTHGQGRYTLWTGDPGLAVYLWHCIGGTAAWPTLDIV
ncbi:MAG TPA: LanC-like protein [Caldimonas sp.]|nr:LanC-like protein [Caldimonas sp.]HEX2542074.1 LanC-like protein [Caldimonas sp.]